MTELREDGRNRRLAGLTAIPEEFFRRYPEVGVMSRTRRSFLALLGTGVVGASSGCQGGTSYEQLSSGRLRTDGSILDDETVDITAEDNQVYTRLIDSTPGAQHVRWDAVADEDASLADSCESTDYESHFLALSGVALPPDRRLARVESRFENGTLYQLHRIEVVEPDRDRPQLHSYLSKWQVTHGNMPDDIYLSRRFNRRDNETEL